MDMETFWMMALIMGLAAVGGIIARMLKQPVILGYIVSGILISVWSGKQPMMAEYAEVMGQIGVTLLLFLVGMELPITELKKMGKTALITGLGQVAISSLMGFGLARLLGWGNETAVYLGLGLSFGSTILLVKMLSEKGDLQSLPGKLAVGFLLVQDFIAVGVLVILTGAANGDANILSLLWLVLKAVILIFGSVYLSQHLIGRVLKYLSRSTELLFITAIGWCLAVASIVSLPYVGFSIEIGGFLAGLAIASSVEQAQIVSRVKPVRDFFLTWFFVSMGFKVNIFGMGQYLVPALIFCGYVLVVNPLIVMFLLGAQGYKKRVAFLASLAMSSVSEFSLILAATAVRTANVSDTLVTVLTMVALVTMTGETYFINHGKEIYKRLAKVLRIVELRKKSIKPVEENHLTDHIVLFGHNRMGKFIRPILDKVGVVVVVDFNPEIVEKLADENVRVVYGDMSDHEMYDELGIKEARLVVSTVPDVTDSIYLLMEMKRWKKRPVVILTAVDDVDAAKLYKRGADYVLVPHSVGGEFLANMLANEDISMTENIARYRDLHQRRLNRG